MHYRIGYLPSVGRAMTTEIKTFFLAMTLSALASVGAGHTPLRTRSQHHA